MTVLTTQMGLVAVAVITPRGRRGEQAKAGGGKGRPTCGGGRAEVHKGVLLPPVKKLRVELLPVPVHEKVDGSAAARTSVRRRRYKGRFRRALVPAWNDANERWSESLEERRRSLVPIHIPAGTVELPSAFDPPKHLPLRSSSRRTSGSTPCPQSSTATLGFLLCSQLPRQRLLLKAPRGFGRDRTGGEF